MMERQNKKENVKHINHLIKTHFLKAFNISLKNPAQACFLFKTLLWQRKAAKVREAWNKKGIHVPPSIIASVTTKCNLRCKGCYVMAQDKGCKPLELGRERLKTITAEAKEMGTSIIVLLGGEPLVRPEIFDIVKDNPEVFFPVFTNGLLINEEMIRKFKEQRNMIPVISLEGYEKETDERRGNGVYKSIMYIIKRLKEEGIFYGISITITKQNYPVVTSENYIRELSDKGAKMFCFTEYIPVEQGTDEKVLTDEQRSFIPKLTSAYRAKFPAMFIAFPGDEKEFGGCLAAGRGFVHLSAGGNLEPCPFAPFSDVNLKNISYKDALQSKLLNKIRENSDILGETEKGCVLWHSREWIDTLMKADDSHMKEGGKINESVGNCGKSA